MNRIIAGFVAILASLALLAAGVAPAEARAARPISIGAYDRAGDAHLKGHVGPNNFYRFKTVLIQRRTCSGGSCAWHNVKSAKTNSASNYDTKVPLPRQARWTYRAVAPASGQFATSRSKALTIFWT